MRYLRNSRRIRPRSLGGWERLESRQLLATLPLISEFMASNQATLPDEDGEFPDWIEIQNPTDQPVQLGGWYLTDDAENLSRWPLPNRTLAPGGFLVVYASGKDRRPVAGPLHTDFRLEASGEFLALVQPDGVTVASSYAPEFPPQVTDVAYGWTADLSERGYLAEPTPGWANPDALADDPLRSIVINEIMYHPASENDAHEYVELWNVGDRELALAGWTITGGIEYSFPDVRLAAGQYLVVAADVPAFQAEYGPGARVVGPWTGRLSNARDQITLRGTDGERIDRVTYADEGDWSVRARGPDDRGSQGWIWLDDHDGGGASLELVNPFLPNDLGQNWKASPIGGTPGRLNSTATPNTAPLLAEVGHDPAIPRSSDPVVIRARVFDEQMTDLQVSLRWRLDGEPEFQSVEMRDDGLAGDEFPEDGIFQAVLLPQADRTVVEYYVQAEDGSGQIRTWPAATQDAGQATNALYQVIDEFDPAAPWQTGSPAEIYQIMTAAERSEFTNIDRRSDAQMNATFIVVLSDGIEVRHNVGVRIRGQGSRNHNPPNNRINIPSDRPWHGLTALNINANVILDQIAGSLLFRLAGLPAAQATPVRMISNGVNLYGDRFYAHLETLNSDFAADHFPLDPNGNLYRGNRAVNSPPGGQGAGLVYHGPDPGPYVSYGKLTNASQADWSDVIHLTDVLNNAPDETYLQQVAEVVDIDQWLRYFALHALLSNSEGGLVNGDRQGDDYVMYRGLEDVRFLMVPHDLDSLFTSVTSGILNATNVPALRRLILHPEIRPRYYQQLHDLIDNVLLTADTQVQLREALSLVASPQEIDWIRNYLQNRANYVRSIIPSGIQINSYLSAEQGLVKTTMADAVLLGTADYRAQSVMINGQVVPFDTQNQWQIGSQVRTLLWNGSTWSYLDNGTDQGSAWREVDFVLDENWKSGRAQLGYGDRDERTEIEYGPDAANKYITSYFRQEFEVSDASRFLDLTLGLIRDDGAVVYLNGVEVVRSNMPAGEPIDYQTLATDNITGGAEGTQYYFNIDPALLREGKNVIAVEVHQAMVDSEDLSFDARLFGRFHLPNAGVPLNPGLNRVVVQAMSQVAGQGEVVAEEYIDIWYDDGDVVSVSGELPAGETVWTAAAGPYHVSGQLVVPANARLTIEPGTSVFFEQDAELLVRGTLVAQGTQHARIRFSSIPGAPFVPNRPGGRPGLPDGPPRWKGIHLIGSMADENVIAFADIEYAQDGDGSIGVNKSSLLVDHVTFRGTHLRMIYGVDASMTVQYSTFPDVFGPDEDPVTIGLDNVAEPIKIIGRTPAGGRLLIAYNTFGTNKGHNDVIDADSNRVTQGPILQIIGNVFHGSGDELLDLGGDVYVAGNLFQNVRKDEYTSDRGYASVMSTGDAGANTTIVVTRNIFDGVDHGINLRNYAATIFEYNTIVEVNPDFVDRFGELNINSAVNLFKPEPGATPGKGAYVAKNIFWDSPRIFGNVDQPDDQVSQLAFTDNLLRESLAETSVGDRPGSVLDLGTGNRVGDPRFVDPTNGDYRLRPGSPATHPDGAVDWGAMIPAGAWIRGVPASPTTLRQATLTVGGPGIFAYRYRLNGGAWSDPISIGSGFDPDGTIRTDTITLQELVDGEYTVEVIGQDFAGNWQEMPTVSQTWTVESRPVHLMISEILADNQTVEYLGSRTDLVELHNAGTSSVNLRGYSLTDDPSRPRKFVFQSDVIIPAGGYLTFVADDQPTSGIGLGFSLRREGESLSLFSPMVNQTPGQLIDAVNYGLQIADYSLGRVGSDREWALTEPTFGQPNRAARLGDASTLKLNEWLTATDNGGDYLELYNPDPLPVALGGLHLSDAPDGNPQRHEIAPLSFLAGGNFQVFEADGDESAGADHLSFRLDLYRGTLGLHDAQLNVIDTVSYGLQTPEVSQGRLPDGAVELAFFEIPTPGWINGAGEIGDVNRDRQIDDADIDRLAKAIREGDPQDAIYDLNLDAKIDFQDLRYLVENILDTDFGDSNLDGIFNTADLVQVLQAGEYEDGTPGNSTWSEGDWNGDGDFGTQDIILALQSGGYSRLAQPVDRDAASPLLGVAIANSPAASDTEFTVDPLNQANSETAVETVHRQIAFDPLPVDSFFTKLGRDLQDLPIPLSELSDEIAEPTVSITQTESRGS